MRTVSQRLVIMASAMAMALLAASPTRADVCSDAWYNMEGIASANDDDIVLSYSPENGPSIVFYHNEFVSALYVNDEAAIGYVTAMSCNNGYFACSQDGNSVRWTTNGFDGIIMTIHVSGYADQQFEITPTEVVAMRACVCSGTGGTVINDCAGENACDNSTLCRNGTASGICEWRGTQPDAE